MKLNGSNEVHVLGVSGGKDSAALAVYMRQYYPHLDITYFFTDTGEELPEVYEFLAKLEGLLGKSIIRLNPDRNFGFWLDQYHHFLPSPQSRWCTKQLKLRPFEQWIKPMLEEGKVVYSYIAIRADEQFREGYASKHKNLITRLPLKDDGIDKSGVLELLENSAIGLPEYYKWRTRSGCTFCFFQQKIEWVRLSREHPEAFQAAKALEKNALDHGSPFTWSQGESLEEMMLPDRLAQIEKDHHERVRRQKSKSQRNPLRPNAEPLDIDDLYGQSKVCLACHK